jgi:thioredoxin-related protein
MKKIILILAILSFGLSVSAQNWVTDFDSAKVIAEKENKKIVLVFQGSDWCAPCMKLDREVWSTEEFKTYAAKTYVMVQADFPRKRDNKLSDQQKQKNEFLMEKYNQQGFFPFVVVFNSQGEVLGNTGYEKTTVTNYIKKLESF